MSSVIALTANRFASLVQHVEYTFALLCALRLRDECETSDGAVKFRRVAGLARDALTGACTAQYVETATGQTYRVTVERVREPEPVTILPQSQTQAWIDSLSEKDRNSALVPSCGVSEGDAA